MTTDADFLRFQAETLRASWMPDSPEKTRMRGIADRLERLERIEAAAKDAKLREILTNTLQHFRVAARHETQARYQDGAAKGVKSIERFLAAIEPENGGGN